MKMKVDPKITDELRSTITNSRLDMSQNRSRRKDLIVQIRAMKVDIKRGETLCSSLDQASIDTSYIRADLKKKRAALNQIRNDLLVAEFQYTITQSVCRSVHRLLDKLNEPFDPERASSSGRKKQHREG